MSASLPPGLFVAGTDTEVGKTFVAAQICRTLLNAGVRVGVYKPAASGCHLEGDEVVADDARTLWEAAGRPRTTADVCPQVFLTPLAPHLAARAEGKEIDADRLLSGAQAWCDSEVLIIEGAGGLMSPLADGLFVADLAYDFGYPLIVVAANQLGAINQTLQTLITAATFRDGISVAGIVLNDCRPSTDDVSLDQNADEITRYAMAPLLARVGHGDMASLANVDWRSLCESPADRR